MTVPHVPKWVEGAPDVLRVGMLLIGDGGEGYLCGSDDDGKKCKYSDVIRYAQLIEPHELSWITEKGLTLR